MNSRMRNFVVVMALVFLGTPGARAQGGRVPNVRLSVPSNGPLVTGTQKIYAIVPSGSAGVEFVFQPEASSDVVVPPIALGTDFGHMEAAYGPDCNGPCEKRVFSVTLGKSLGKLAEGWGRLTARDIGTGDAAGARVYWDPTPPIAKFETPLTNPRLDRDKGLEVVAHTFDEDVTAIRVRWAPAPLGARNIPQFEQHDLGYDFANHAACVPTSISANLKWLQNTGAADVLVPPFDADNRKLVEVVGNLMNTDSSGTSGDELVAGLQAFLLITKGYFDGQDYDFESVGPGQGLHGITPDELLAQFSAGGAISVGFHNLDGEPSFGHQLVLANVTSNSDGSAWMTVMDPHVEQAWPSPSPITHGEFRRFLLRKDGRVEWTAGHPGYYFPDFGQVKFDEMHILRNFQLAISNAAGGATIESNTASAGGEVPGVLTQGGRTFVGRFTPPPGSTGPWLLTSETTHRAGHTMRSYLYVAGSEAPTAP